VNDIRVIQEYINEAQLQLAQLNAMLQQQQLNDESSGDAGAQAEIEFDPSPGRHQLLQARKFLALANRKFAIWQEFE
jgi:hypothetical protein